MFRREREPDSLNLVWLVDLLFWVAIAGIVLTGVFFFRHDFSSCDPTYESCFTD
jgi:hypothetical protein